MTETFVEKSHELKQTKNTLKPSIFPTCISKSDNSAVVQVPKS